MKDFSEADDFLGLLISINRSKRTLQISQTAYINKVLERFVWPV